MGRSYTGEYRNLFAHDAINVLSTATPLFKCLLEPKVSSLTTADSTHFANAAITAVN